MIWAQSCKYTLSISGIKSVSGETMTPFMTHWYSPFHPLWGNIDVIMLDLNPMTLGLTEETVTIYMYQASLDAWRGIKYGGLWPIPDINKSLDELLIAGYPEDAVAAIECYVRWRTQYLILRQLLPGLAASGGNVEKALGDFRISRRGSATDLLKALESSIEPEMNACYYILAGRQKTKPSPAIVQRASSAESVRRSAEGRAFMPPGFRQGRTW